jgi:hypothetical protein
MMTTADLAKCVVALEKTVAELQAQIEYKVPKRERWWIEGAGRFANDLVFDEIVQLGREYLESLRPRRRTKKA